MTIDYSISLGNILTLLAMIALAAGAFRRLITFETKIDILWRWFEEHILKSNTGETP